MHSSLLNEIPNKYKSLLNQIQNNILTKIYTYLTFFYLDLLQIDEICNSCNKNKIVDTILFNYLKCFKFITYQITSDIFNFQFLTENEKIPNPDTTRVNAIICIEKECFIIENINYSLICAIIIKLKQQNIAMLDIIKNHRAKNIDRDEMIANEEVDFFCGSIKESRNNFFIEYTIRPIAGYLIRRHFYPYEYFKDQSFFIKSNEEENIKTRILNFLKNGGNNKEVADQQLIEIYNEIQAYNIKNQNINYEKYDEKDFIKLRLMHSNDQALFYLVIHQESFFIFMMKLFKNVKIYEDEREKEFCKNFKNRCLVHFHGFVEKNNKTVGLIYEYLPNDSLKSYIITNQNRINEFFSLDTMIRIFQGINYLHSNQFIHRDIKSENILLDNNYVPFISDFPTIRHPMSKEKDKAEFTNDIGSIIYSSPEQYHGDFISYPTDIYSFGILIYFLYEKNENIYQLKLDKNYILPKVNNLLSNINDLYQACINNNQEDRIKIEDILTRIINEINIFLNKDKSKIINVNKNLIIQLIYDIYSIKQFNPEEIKPLNQGILNCKSYFCTKINESELQKERFSISQLIDDFPILSDDIISYDSINQILYCYYNLPSEKRIDYKAAYVLSKLYFDNKYTSPDIIKSIHYLEIVANNGYTDAQVELGNILYEGKLVKRNINKSIHFFMLASDKNNKEAHLSLATLYLNGAFIPRDIRKSIYYFTLASNQNDLNAQLILGTIYFDNKFIKPDIKKSIYFYSLAAKQNNIKAQNLLGHFYYDGKLLPRDINNSIHYFTLAANQNDSDSQYMLGLTYFGKYVSRDIDKSVHYLTLAANQNNVNAQFRLGLFYYDGIYTSIEINQAIHFFTLSANQNYPEAQFMLGRIYYEGIHISIDIQKSIHYLSLAAKLSNVHAQYMLGDIYYNGKYILRDINKAIYYFSLAANQNLPYAQNMLGIIYNEGKYVKCDIDKAFHYLSLAAAQNILDAQVNLGYLYFKMHDIKNSIKYFTLAANKNDQMSQLWLASIYMKGVYIKRDINLSIYYYKLAAEQNNIKALNNLGLIYYKNIYIQRNINESIRYFTLAAKQNDSYAHFALGQIYYEDLYIARDIYKAIYHLKLAADQNNKDAQYILGDIYYTGKYISQDIKQSIHYLSLAADQNSIDAQIMFGIIYYVGRSIPRDMNKSIHYFTLASNQNDPEAQNALGLIFYEGKYISSNINKSVHYFKLAANQNYPIAQYNLGYIYFHDKSIQNINQGIKYIQYSSQNKNRDAQLFLADLLLEGKYLKRDVQQAIVLYKNCSNLKNQHAKNNLGVIYKNGYNQIEKNIVLAKEYFNEANKNANDMLSMYNLSNILLDEDESQSISIKLLIESSLQGFYPSIILLCLLLLKKYDLLNLYNVEQELMAHNIKSKKLIPQISHILSSINALALNKKLLLNIYHRFRKMDLVYINHEIKTLKKLLETPMFQVGNKTSKLNDINEYFYEGFALNI